MGGAALAQALFQQRLHGLKFGQIRERAQLALALSRTLDDGVKHRQRKPVAMQEHHKYRLLAAIGLGQHRFLAADGVARLKAVVACNMLLYAAARLQSIGQVSGQEALAIVLLQQVVEKVVRQLCQLRCPMVTWADQIGLGVDSGALLNALRLFGGDLLVQVSEQLPVGIG